MDILAVNRVDGVGVLADRTRGELFRLVAASDHAMSRDEVAQALGVPRSTVAFHLDRLLEAGLLTVEHRRLSGRSGPGAGRPTKLYRPAATDVIASVPERHYELAGELLAASIERSERDGIPIRAALETESQHLGLMLGRTHDALEDALARCGYAPADDGEGGLTLENCPFHALATRHTPLVCGANLALVQGLAQATADARIPALEPTAGRCCVAVHPAGEAVETGPAHPRDED